MTRAAEHKRSLPVLDQAPAAPERADARRNRERILSVTRRLMKKKKLAAICMDEVAAAAGVGKGTLYRHFADRSALLLAVLDQSERELQEQVIAGLGIARGGSAADRLLALLDALLAFHVEHAQVLAAVEATARPFGRFDNAPYQWRHDGIARGLEAAGLASAGHAAQLADVMLQALSGEVLCRALEHSDEAGVVTRTKALFCALVHRQTTGSA